MFEQKYQIDDRVKYCGFIQSSRYINANGTVIGIDIRRKVHMRFPEDEDPNTIKEFYLVKFDHIDRPKWCNPYEIQLTGRQEDIFSTDSIALLTRD